MKVKRTIRWPDSPNENWDVDDEGDPFERMGTFGKSVGAVFAVHPNLSKVTLERDDKSVVTFERVSA